MSGGSQRDVWADLVESLLDVRSDPATARFDVELAAAVADGSVTDEAAHRLRYWQRASLRALADHARGVLPVALGALEAARRDAETYVEESAELLALDDLPPDAAPELPESPTPDVPTVLLDVPAEADPARRPACESSPATSDDDVRRASVPRPAGPPTLEGRGPRLLVAGLTTVPLHTDHVS